MKGCPLEDFSINKLSGIYRLCRALDKQNILLKAIRRLEDIIHEKVRECPYRQAQK